MADRFDSFILLAEMRTGSNFLEDTLNTLAGLKCWGESFNPHFVGHANRSEQAGITLQEREIDPLRLLTAIRGQTDGLPGFRFFHDHDPRILRHCLADPRCAKVVLTRNPLDSFVSLEIARQTGQWRLSDLKSAKTARVTFDADAFSRHLSRLQAFQQVIQRSLQTSGQTASHIGYDDLNDIDVLNGLAAFLGIKARLDQTSTRTKVQNPGSLRDKVVNYDSMIAALGSVDHFDLGRTPNFEPRRGPNVPGFVTAATSPLLYMPVRGAAEDRVNAWLTALDGAPPLAPEMSQKDLRRWMRQNTGHRSFTVVRHPVARIHATFLRHILATGPDSFADLRATLKARYDVPLPDSAECSTEQHRAAFIGFLKFVRGNLGGQTSIRTDPAWASQSTVIQGMAQFALPDMILRAESLGAGVTALAEAIGATAPDVPEDDTKLLAQIHDDTVEQAVRDIYQRDYLIFGYRPWNKPRG